MPSNFSDDLYVIDGKIIAAMTTTENEGHSVSVLTNKFIAEVKADYENKLKDKDWKIELQMNNGKSAMLSASKAGRTTTVSITSDIEGTIVTIVTNKN